MIFCADLPKPLHGMSNINQKVLDILSSRNCKIYLVPTVPSYAHKFFGTKIWSFIKLFHTLYCVVKILSGYIFGHRLMYRPVNGGSGQVFDLIYLSIARLFLSKIIIHHHSFQYLNNKTFLFGCIAKLAGKNAKHIVLGEEMILPLANLYGIDKKQLVIVSNLAFFDNVDVLRQDAADFLTIGHLANLCEKKGVDVFEGVFSKLSESAIQTKGILAGPCVDSYSRQVVEKLSYKKDTFHYIGPVNGDEKNKFYDSIDVFIFFSKYENEAEPLVLYEAAARGAFLIGSDRGCMKSVIEKFGGACLQSLNDPVYDVVQLIKNKLKLNEFSQGNKKTRVVAFNNGVNNAKQSLNQLIDILATN